MAISPDVLVGAYYVLSGINNREFTLDPFYFLAVLAQFPRNL